MSGCHKSVLVDEIIKYLQPRPGGVYVDATLGGGGHTEEILKKLGPRGKVIGIDIDPRMLDIARERLPRFKGRLFLVAEDYVNLRDILSEYDIDQIAGIVFDLGVSTEHFKEAQRGFSFSLDGPLDMRLNPGIRFNAADIVNKWKPRDLLEILYQYGQEQRAKRIARRIEKERKLKKILTTGQLAEIVIKAVGGGGSGRIHPATKTFQALRIAVNNELEKIKTALPTAIQLLKPGGRICVISFHSLEDRLVKNIFRQYSRSADCFPEFLPGEKGSRPLLKIITKKPVSPRQSEIMDNQRSRSAKLRVAEKI